MVSYNDLDDDSDSTDSASDDLASSVGMQPDASSDSPTDSPVASTMAPAPGAMPGPAPASTPINPIVQQYLAQKQQLASAQTQANSNQLYAGLARSFGNMSAGMAGAKPVDQSGFNALDASAEQPVTDVQNAQKSQSVDLANQQSSLAVDKMQKSEDPNSPESLAAKTLIQKLYPGKFTADQLAPLSASDVGDSIMKPLELDQKIQEAKQVSADRSADRQLKQEEISDNQNTKQISDYQGRLDKDKNFQDATSALSKANDALKIADDAVTNPQSANSLAVTLASLSTGGKRINSAEIERMGGSKAFTDHLSQIIDTGYKGTMTPDNVANAKQYIKIFQDSYAQSVQDSEMRKANELSQVNNRPLRENYTKITGKDYPQAQQSTSSQSPDLQSSVAAEIARRQAAKASQSQTVPPSQFGVGAPVDPTSVVPANSYAYGGFVGGLPASNFSAGQAMKIPKAPALHLPPIRHFDQGGVVPGKPQFNHNDPRNDVVPAMVSRGEMVLPLSVTQSKDPAMAAYIFMKQKMKGQ